MSRLNKENNVFKDAIGVKGLRFKLHGNHHGNHYGNHCNLHGNYYHPPKQDNFEGWIIKYQIGSNLRRVHNQIFRALASTTTKIRSVLGNPLKMRNFHNK